MAARSGAMVTGRGYIAYGEGVNKKLHQAVVDTALDIAVRAQKLAPVETGALAASIYAATDTESGYFQAVADAQSRRPEIEVLPPAVPQGPYEAMVGIAAPYWEHVEFGTAHQPAKPFLMPAFEQYRLIFSARIADAMRPDSGSGSPTDESTE